MGDNNVGQGRRIRSVLVANRSEIAIRVRNRDLKATIVKPPFRK